LGKLVLSWICSLIVSINIVVVLANNVNSELKISAGDDLISGLHKIILLEDVISGSLFDLGSLNLISKEEGYDSHRLCLLNHLYLKKMGEIIEKLFIIAIKSKNAFNNKMK
jgi:hypothetical protein